MLDVFHRQCVRTLLGVSREEQFLQRFSNRDLGQRAGLLVNVNTLLRQHRLRWLGHVARMHPHEDRSRCCCASSLQLNHATEPGSGGTTLSAPISLLSVPLIRVGMTQLGIARSGVYWLATSVPPRPRRGVSTVTVEGPSAGAEI